MTEEQHLREALKQLAIGLRNEIKDRLSKGEIGPRMDEYFRWKVDQDQFQYNENGVLVGGKHGEPFIRESWIFITSKFENSIKKSDLYNSALEVLTKVVGDRDKAINDLSYFIGRLFRGNADKWKSGEAAIDNVIEIFLKHKIKGEPFRYGAEVELDGIVVLPRDIIEFKIGDTNIMLRQTRIEDLEKEFPTYGVGMGADRRHPSAIMRVEFGGGPVNEVHRKVEQAIAILRLYKVGSVELISYRLFSEDVTDLLESGVLMPNSAVSSLEKSRITQQDSQKLKNFGRLMAENLPPSFYELGETVPDHMTISYRRYCDALLVNGVLERRIANAVMGLESLFLGGKEIQELPYRLSMRVAKILSYLSYNPSEVKDVVRCAYRVRNLFVHGSHLLSKDKTKLENRHGNINDFLKLLLDYLRVSIIITILTKRKKEEFLDLIDNALLDKVKDDQLNSVLHLTRDAISVNP